MLKLLLCIELPSAIYAWFRVGTTDWTLLTARYNGFAINLCIVWILLFGRRNIAKLLTKFKINKNIERTLMHNYLAGRFIVAATIHAIAHTIRQYNSQQTNQQKTYAWPLNATELLSDTIYITTKATTTANQWPQWFSNRETWTGLLCILMSIALFATGIRLTRYMRYHQKFFLSHKAIYGLFLLPLLCFHYDSAKWWLLSWLGIELMDQMLGRLKYREQCIVLRANRYPNHQLENERQINDVVEITVRYQHGGEFLTPGDYVRVAMQRRNRWCREWHDFTMIRGNLTTNNEFQHRLIVRSVGDWTNNLYRTIEPGTVLTIDGPYDGNPKLKRIFQEQTTMANRKIFLICSGTAITQILSIVEHLLINFNTSDKRPKEIILCWIVRTIFNLNFALRTLNDYQAYTTERGCDKLLRYEFYISQQPNNSDSLCAQTFRQLMNEAMQPTTSTQTPLLPYKEDDKRTIERDSTENVPLIAKQLNSSMWRNSKICMMNDPIESSESTQANFGERLDCHEFARKHLNTSTENEKPLLLVCSSVKKIRRKFNDLATQYKCEVLCMK